VGVVIVLARDVALGASLLGALGLRHLLVSGTAIYLSIRKAKRQTQERGLDE
jgi:hypothetical protein